VHTLIEVYALRILLPFTPLYPVGDGLNLLFVFPTIDGLELFYCRWMNMSGCRHVTLPPLLLNADTSRLTSTGETSMSHMPLLTESAKENIKIAFYNSALLQRPYVSFSRTFGFMRYLSLAVFPHDVSRRFHA
jgi:hypothetical protein